MNEKELSELFKNVDFIRLLLLDYNGPYSMGVVKIADGELAVRLCVMPEAGSDFQANLQSIDWNGVHIPVVVRRDFQIPRLL